MEKHSIGERHYAQIVTGRDVIVTVRSKSLWSDNADAIRARQIVDGATRKRGLNILSVASWSAFDELATFGQEIACDDDWHCWLQYEAEPSA